MSRLAVATTADFLYACPLGAVALSVLLFFLPNVSDSQPGTMRLLVFLNTKIIILNFTTSCSVRVDTASQSAAVCQIILPFYSTERRSADREPRPRVKRQY